MYIFISLPITHEFQYWEFIFNTLCPNDRHVACMQIMLSMHLSPARCMHKEHSIEQWLQLQQLSQIQKMGKKQSPRLERWLSIRALPAIPDRPGSAPSTMWRLTTVLNSESQGIWCPTLASEGIRDPITGICMAWSQQGLKRLIYSQLNSTLGASPCQRIENKCQGQMSSLHYTRRMSALTWQGI